MAEKSVRRFACNCGGIVIYRADGGGIPTQCAFCHSSLSTPGRPFADASDREIATETNAASPSPPERWPIVVAELVCLMCARPTGTAMAEQWPPTAPILFQAADRREAVVVRAWWR